MIVGGVLMVGVVVMLCWVFFEVILKIVYGEYLLVLVVMVLLCWCDWFGVVVWLLYLILLLVGWFWLMV